MSRYTPSAANEARTWIEETLGEKLSSGDLLENLKDGTVLCRYVWSGDTSFHLLTLLRRLANLALPPPGIKFKKSNMPFTQMENISHFLSACERAPINLPAHDRFLTVDLYEGKDPAQVLQCLGAFSRVANGINPSRFPTTIGPKRGGAMSPSHTGASNGYGGLGAVTRGTGTSNATANSSALPSRDRALSPTLTGGSNSSRATDGGPKSPSGPVSSWSKKTDEGITAPAWNIHQYGYMGGASQGNQGISFGARRQITSAGPHVPSLAEKERKRREKEAEDERLRQEAEEAERKRRIEREAEEERERIAERERFEAETRRLREEEKRRVEQQKREWEEQERRWKAEEEARLREEREAEAQLQREKTRNRANSDARLRGQYLSEYQAEEKARSRQTSYNDPERNADHDRVQELERQLAQAKERERQYLEEREERFRHETKQKERRNRSRSRSRPRLPAREPSVPEERNVSWEGDERAYLRQQWQEQQAMGIRTPTASRPLPDPTSPSSTSRPLPQPTAAPISQPNASRPLPDPSDYSAFPNANPPSNRTGRFLSQNPAPVATPPRSFAPAEMGLTSESERLAEDARRAQSQAKTKAGGWASKSLLEREMERERERQREWEEAQKASAKVPRDRNQGVGPGQSWDVNQYGYTGGDSQNRVSVGIGFGGRRQIIGPRPAPGGPR